MEKVYRLLEWLNKEQAIDWLQDLTKTPVTYLDILRLCDAGQCAVYVDGAQLTGWLEDFSVMDVSGSGMQKTRNPLVLQYFADYYERDLELAGYAWVIDKELSPERLESEWTARTLVRDQHPRFKSTDIQALAAKMNALQEQPSPSSLEELKSQWELEKHSKMLETRKQLDAEARERFINDAVAENERLQRTLDQLMGAQEAYEETILNAESKAEYWEQNHKLELECRLETQAEAGRLQAELGRLESEAKPSHLLAIAGLLELLLDDSRPRYQQGSAAERIEARGWRGASVSALTKLFAEARATAADADKVAQAKAEAREAVSTKAKSVKR
ncbi:hypothetical protein [Pseudomonas spirodelae]|uniref:Uncharacterized protein n=1 Tax=Pseudomonas spirodelae TaxID=3101751 RepID=A0ABU5PED3_9PSED|nr:hypothetical protein [Pseudomonas sp. T5W1]MEA1608044.1 hypothetical protein [Pseudomonas sp. T5W1]